MTAGDCDWLHYLPCEERIHPDVVSGLDPWFRDLLAASPDRVRETLAVRWGSLPDALRPLANRLLEAGRPALVGGARQAFLRLTIDPRGRLAEHPWKPRPWATPWRFVVEQARAFLRRDGFRGKDVESMDDGELERTAMESWDPAPLPPSPRKARAELLRRGIPADAMEGLDDRFLVFLASTHHYRGEEPPDDEDWSWDLYLPPPPDREEARGAIARLGIAEPGPVLEFAVGFDGVRESPPRLSGGFEPVARWRTIREEGFEEEFLAGWQEALVVFVARNGDHVLLHPSGRVAWMVFAEHRVDERWPTLEEFVHHYADHLDYRWPFDSYGPPDSAVEARLARDSRPAE
ncbi:MAG: hypothetical protein HY720_21635 [Planctomycetes bacterium]|nr:hypothetical protein [Planctomycetota bacterium]